MTHHAPKSTKPGASGSPGNVLIPEGGLGASQSSPMQAEGRTGERNVLPEKYLTTKIDTQSWIGGGEEEKGEREERVMGD